MRLWTRIATNPGLWPCIGALGLFAVASAVIGAGGVQGLLATTLVFAGFYLIVGLGQMIVITAGNGNIDLSIPAVMTLSAYIAMDQMHGPGAAIPMAIAMGIAVGAICGLANAVLIIAIRVPPMIATLASGFIVQSIAIAYSRGTTAPPAALAAEFAISSVGSIPTVALLAGCAALGVAFIMRYSVFGRSVSAIGQNLRAARFASIRIGPTLAGVYLLASIFAALAGILYASYSGGASLGMAQDFLVISIAVVVIGGTNVAGGSSSVVGLAGAAAFFYLAVTVLNILQLNPGIRAVTTGVFIIAILALGGKREAK